jgi:predicted nucleic acid-binding protein
LTVYLDTSAAARLLATEAESDALTVYLDDHRNNGRPASSTLLETELRRFALRVGMLQSAVSNLLDEVDLVEPDRSLFTEAGLLPGVNLRSLDALHVATALRLDASVVVAYDHRLQQAARDVGLATTAPGQVER